MREDVVEVKGVAVAESASESTDSDDDADVGTERDQPDDTAAPESGTPRRISLSVRTLVVGFAIALLVAALGTMTWLYLGERDTIQAQTRGADNRHHAEQLSLDYAVGAATMNFQDLNAWKGKLVQGTSPELHEKLNKAADSMEQLLIPLQWNSTSEPLVAKVRSETNGVYVVDTFVSVLTKTTQAPDNLQSTATYSITIDSNNNWQITDVGGIGAVAGVK
jgi:hypothetical protein